MLDITQKLAYRGYPTEQVAVSVYHGCNRGPEFSNIYFVSLDDSNIRRYHYADGSYYGNGIGSVRDLVPLVVEVNPLRINSTVDTE